MSGTSRQACSRSPTRTTGRGIWFDDDTPGAEQLVHQWAAFGADVPAGTRTCGRTLPRTRTPSPASCGEVRAMGDHHCRRRRSRPLAGGERTGGAARRRRRARRRHARAGTSWSRAPDRVARLLPVDSPALSPRTGCHRSSDILRRLPSPTRSPAFREQPDARQAPRGRLRDDPLVALAVGSAMVTCQIGDGDLLAVTADGRVFTLFRPTNGSSERGRHRLPRVPRRMTFEAVTSMRDSNGSRSSWLRPTAT